MSTKRSKSDLRDPCTARGAIGLTDRALLWLDGSLFFRAVMGVMDFLRRVCAGSFLVGLFTADYDGDKQRNSGFVRAAEYVLNRCPKILAPLTPVEPSNPSNTLSTSSALSASSASSVLSALNILSGSWLVRRICDALDTPLPVSLPAPSPASLPAPAKDANPVAALRWPAAPRWLLAFRWLSVLLWLAASAPIWGLLLITVGAPFLPTMMLAGLLLAVTAVALLRYRFTVDLTGTALLVFIGVTLFYGVTSFTPASSLPIALLSSTLMFSYLTISACCRKRKQLDFFFFAFISAAAGTGLIGFYQFVTKKVDTTWVDVELFGDITFRAYASFNNPNVYGTFLLLAIPLCAVMVLYAKHYGYKLYALGITCLLLFNLYKTYSRGCYLALAVAALVFVLLTEKRLIVAFAAGLVAAPFLLPPTMLNRLMSITNLADSSTSYRLSIWQGTLRIIKDFWMAGLGQGIEAYNVVYPAYGFNAVIAPHSHNLFLQVFVETGIVGLLVFVALLACFFRQMACYLRRTADRRSRTLAAAMVAAVTGFLFQGLFDYVFYNYSVLLIFFIFIGLACAFTAADPASEPMPEPMPEPTPEHVP